MVDLRREDLTREASEARSRFPALLDHARTPESLISLFAQYLHFNSPFGAGVSGLAGEVAAREDLFCDRAEPMSLMADKSGDVASEIFYAALGEFAERRNSSPSHRRLAALMLREIGNVFRIPAARMAELTAASRGVLASAAKVRDGYGLNQEMTEEKIFQAIGFHIGSEILADQEFAALDRFLRDRFGELVARLEAATLFDDGGRLNAYSYVRIHTVVEADHFDAALSSANNAL